MTKGTETRERIVARAAPLFNRQGYSGASMADIMEATGLKKGGIYNHFASKDELAVAAFEHNCQIFRDEYAEVLRDAGPAALDRLEAVISVHARFADHPRLPGGCPLLNTAIESDDGHPVLRQHVRAAMDEWRGLLARILRRGVASGEFHPAIDCDEVATVMISTIEGGVMLSKLYATPDHLQRAVAHVRSYIRTMVSAGR